MLKEIYVKNPGKTIITITEKSITIKRKGVLNAMTQGSKGEKTIPFKNITAIQLKKPVVTSGYIQFTLAGGNESRGGVFNATADENTVMFSSKYWKEMQELKAYIEERQDELDQPTVNTTIIQKSAVEQVKELKELLDMGIITDAEFEVKKQELLGL